MYFISEKILKFGGHIDFQLLLLMCIWLIDVGIGKMYITKLFSYRGEC